MRVTLILYIFFLTVGTKSYGQQFTSNYKILDKRHGLSQVTVTSIIQDRNGFIWVGTQGGLNRFDGNEFKVFQSNPTDSTSLSNNYVTSMTEDSDGNIWVATFAGGVCKYDPRTEKFKRYIRQEKDTTKISSNVITVIHTDDENRVWIGHTSGIDLYNPEKDAFEPVLISEKINSMIVDDLVSDENNNIWIGTRSDVIVLNAETKQTEKIFKHDPNDKNTISGNWIRQISVDNNGLIWIMTLGYYMNSINPKTNEVKHYFNNPSENKPENNPHTRYIYHSKSGEIWLATEFYGLVKFDPETETIKLPTNQPVKETNTSAFQGLTIFEDSTGSFWMGTYETGLIHYNINANPFNYRRNLFSDPNDPRTDSFTVVFEDKDGFLWLSTNKKGLSRLDRQTNTVETFPEIPKYLKINESDLRVQNITQDKNGYLWIGTRGNGFIRLDPKTREFKVYENRINQNNQTGRNAFHIIYEDHEGKLWIAALGILTVFNPETENFKIYRYNPDNDKSLPGPVVSAIFEDDEHNIWLGFYSDGIYYLDRETETFHQVEYEPNDVFDPDAKIVTCFFYENNEIVWIGTTGGLFKYNKNTKASEQYTNRNGLPSNTIYLILKDEKGNLWLSTNDGISKFNPEKGSFSNYQPEDGLKQAEFNIFSGCISKTNGLMYFGGPIGLNFFDPMKIKDNPNIPPVAIAEFKKYNTKGDFVEIPGVNYADLIELTYKERDFSVELASLDYNNPSKNQYAYRLEGYNKNWVEIGNKREISFTNLSPGNYTLKVKGSNNDGVWNEQGKSLQINILPPWWGTWWAYSLYALAFLGLLYTLYRYRVNQIETDRLKELDEAKRKMYTNITHEFRTPLTVISGINKELQEQTDERFKEQLDLIEYSSRNMLYLVNQLLEVRKLESGKMSLYLIQDDIISFLKYIVSSFETYGKTKNISVHFVSITNTLIMDYDADKLLMIMSNLLSNAVKYSNAGDDIYLQVDEIDNTLQIRVVDSGRGIPEKELPRIFDRFYKIENYDDDNIDGVGIGLAVTKELVELIGGEITVSSKINKGSIFTLTLPIHNKAPLANTTDKENIRSKIVTMAAVGDAEIVEKPIITPSENVLNLLVIEDNKNIVAYLSSFLKNEWNLDFAGDGRKGIDKAIEHVPDIILCDLMMPNANGYEVLEALKNDSSTSHIPIVILTAKADDESRLKAYKKGADAFLLKPFNKEELLIILEKLVKQRRLLQERYKSQVSLKFAEGKEIKKEDDFIQKIENIILTEKPESNYSISNLCDDLGMSRTQLHNKIKALTGRSTSIFVRSLRLQKGKYLLEHSDKTISEIAYEVGFNNPSYFTKSFTEEFGLPPSSLRK
jgi:signal transduction histidine kinase/ligand-binding sensor domain-containing protein/CheY-like chemotaxis protein/AraC-like DNA-binding protein